MKRLGLAVLLLSTGSALAFTQSGGGVGVGGSLVPMGHEWITSISARELLGDRAIPATDPRTSLAPGKGRALNLDLTKDGTPAAVADLKKGAHTFGDAAYSSGYLGVYSAIIGERWVDLGGMNVAKGKVAMVNYDCFDAAVQEPDDNMYDHFMRRWEDHGIEGALKAIEASRARFSKHFVAAAMAPAGKMWVYDGGVASNAVEVERRYFLFGRALHLLQDSFSPEHTVRTVQDNFTAVHQIKGYLCAKGAEHHSFKTPTAASYANNGDVIWNEDVGNLRTYSVANMKPVARAAVEATKDAWAAFLRTLGVTDPNARRLFAAEAAKQVAGLWMAYAPDDVRKWYGTDQAPKNRGATYLPETSAPDYATCVNTMEGKFGSTGKTTANEKMEAIKATLRAHQRACLFNIGPKDAAKYPDFDPSLHIPYYWEWKHWTWHEAPANWTLPEKIGDYR